MSRRIPGIWGVMVGGAIAAASCGTPARNPNASMNRYRLAVDEFRKHELPAATKDLEAALKYDSENADAHNLLGIIYVQKGIDNIDLAEKRRCEKGAVGDSLRKEAQGWFVEARRRFENAVRARPDYAEAYNNLANVAIQLGRYQDAVHNAEEALAYAPKLIRVETARANLGWAYYHLHDYVKAEQELLQATANDASFCLGAYRLAKVQWDQRRPDRVIEVLEELMRREKCPILEAHYLLGMAFVSRQQEGSARTWFDSCATLEPASCLAQECRRSAALLPPPGAKEPGDAGDESGELNGG